jgi:multidrug efflux system membrane fusion protein
MKRRILVMLGATLAFGAVVAAEWSNWAPWEVWSPKDAAAQAQKQPTAPRAVPVEVVTAVKKKVPVRVDLLGTVTPIVSVAVKTRVDIQVKVARVMDSQSILESGPEGGELVVTEGQVQIIDASRASARETKAGS